MFAISRFTEEQSVGWIGYPFDPAALDINAVNQRLARIEA